MKNFLLFAALFCCVNAFAQDVILKRDGSDIKAKVLEITGQQVKYKDYDFQSGPTRNINISDVFMITYENGRKEVFNQQSSAPAPKGENYNAPPQSDLQKEFYRIGSDDDEMLNFFRRNNFNKYYEDFQSACRMRSAGKGLFGAGMGLSAAGLVLTVTGVVLWEHVDEDYGFYITWSGVGVLGAGQVLVIASIPVSAVAGGKKKAIKNDFVKQHFGVDAYCQPRLNFGLTTTGVGFVLNF